MTGSASLPFAVVYLMLVFVEALGIGVPVTAEYVQDGEPVSQITVLPEEGPGLYRIVGVGRDEAEPTVVRVEASAVAGHHYLVHAPDQQFPLVLSLAPVYDELALHRADAVRTLTIATGEITASGNVELNVGSELHVIRRGAVTVLSAPESGVVLLVTGE